MIPASKDRCLGLLLLLFGLFCSFGSLLGCRGTGEETTRLDYTYQKPIWTDASLEKSASKDGHSSRMR